MVPVTLSFPLFKLPYLAWRNVLRTMDGLELFQASLCTKNMKRVVRSLFPKPNKCRIDIDNGELNVMISGAVVVRVGFLFSDLLTLEPCTMLFQQFRSTTLLSFRNFGPKNWLDHMFEVFHVKRISNLLFGYIPNLELVDMRILGSLTQGLEIAQLDASIFVRGEHIPPIWNNFPNAETLCLFTRPDYIPQIENLKFNSVHFHHKLSVDEVLSLNAKFISVPIEDFEFNQVLKKWVEGWNPLLTGMKLEIRRRGDSTIVYDRVFDGIDHEGPLITEKGTQFTIKNSEGILANIYFDIKTNDVDFVAKRQS